MTSDTLYQSTPNLTDGQKTAGIQKELQNMPLKETLEKKRSVSEKYSAEWFSQRLSVERINSVELKENRRRRTADVTEWHPTMDFQ